MFLIRSFSVSLITISSLINFIKQRRHILICLIALEGVILTIGLIYIIQRSELELFVLFILFTFGACEASLGLACLVIIIRSFGDDNFKVLRGIKC